MEETSPHEPKQIPFPNLPVLARDPSTAVKEEQGETGHFSKNYSLSVLPIKKRRKPQRWTDQDTKLFYTCLEIYGMDFRMMRNIFSPRTLRQIMRKFHKERKKHPEEVDRALSIHEGNKISCDPGKPINFLDGLLNQSQDSDQVSIDASDDSLQEVVRTKLKMQLEAPGVGPFANEDEGGEIRPLEYYLDLS
jgi:hypothetical protein